MSQGTRQITYASVKDTSGAKTIFSKATTLGELKNSDADLKIASQGMKAWVKSIEGDDRPGYSLDTEGAILPEGNFELVFLNNKNDSGNSADVEKIIDTFIAELIKYEEVPF